MAALRDAVGEIRQCDLPDQQRLADEIREHGHASDALELHQRSGGNLYRRGQPALFRDAATQEEYGVSMQLAGAAIADEAQAAAPVADGLPVGDSLGRENNPLVRIAVERYAVDRARSGCRIRTGCVSPSGSPSICAARLSEAPSPGTRSCAGRGATADGGYGFQCCRRPLPMSGATFACIAPRAAVRSPRSSTAQRN